MKKRIYVYITLFFMMVTIICVMPVNADELTYTYLMVSFDDETDIPQALKDKNNDTRWTSKGGFCRIEDGYLGIAPYYANTGFSLADTISCNDDSEYKIEFDFKIPEKSNAGYQMMLINEKVSDYNDFGLIGVTADGYFRVAGIELTGLKYDEEKWYSYKVIFNPKAAEIYIKITEKDGIKRCVEYKGVAKRTAEYGQGIPVHDYKMLCFSFEGEINVDNIAIERYTSDRFNVDVTSDNTGNIFDGNDEKRIKIDIKNISENNVNADVDYVVYDENKNIADRGNICKDNLFEKNTSQVFEKNLNITKYGTYSIVFDITDSGRYLYTTEEYDLSVVNKCTGINKTAGIHIPDIVSDAGILTDEYIALITQAGVGGVRFGVGWQMVEPHMGDTVVIPGGKDFFQQISERGIDILVTVNAFNSDYGAKYGSSYPHLISTEENKTKAYTSWENYLKFIAENLGEDITYYEIFNEADCNDNLKNPSVYADYLKRANKAIKSKDADAEIIGLVTGGFNKPWIIKVLDKIKDNPKEYLDIASVHPYDFVDANDTESFEKFNTLVYKDTGSDAVWNWGIHIRDDLYETKMNELEQMLSGNSCEDMPVVISEIGLSEMPGICTERKQAADLTQTYVNALAQGKQAAIYWHCLEDSIPEGNYFETANNPEANFGIVGNRENKVPFAAKPAYVAMAGYNKMMAGMKPVDSAKGNLGKVYRFKNDNNEQIAVAWAENTVESMTIDFGCEQIDVYDLYSNKIATMKSNDGIYSIGAGTEPVYIKGDFTKLQKSPTNEVYISEGNFNMDLGDEKEITITDTERRNIKVEIVSSPELQVSQNPDGTIKVKLTGGSANEAVMDIKVYAGETVIYCTRVYINPQKIELGRVFAANEKVEESIDQNTAEILIDVKAENVTDEGMMPKLIMAYFDGNKTLQDVEIQEVQIQKRGIIKQKISLNIPENCESIKIMLLDGLETLRPLSGSLKYLTK